MLIERSKIKCCMNCDNCKVVDDDSSGPYINNEDIFECGIDGADVQLDWFCERHLTDEN